MASIQKQIALVAICDILGFSQLVRRTPLEDVVSNALNWFRRALHHSIHKNGFPDDVPNQDVTQGHPLVGVAWFSDTVLLYTRGDSDDAVRELISTVGWLIFETILHGSTRIRGGISYGELLVDSSNSIYVGKAIVDAYDLERRQQWAGAALTPTAYERVPAYARNGTLADWWVIPHRVPCKSDESIDALAVNWTWGMHQMGWQPRWHSDREMPNAIDWANQPDVCQKFINTKAFHDAHCRWCKRT